MKNSMFVWFYHIFRAFVTIAVKVKHICFSTMVKNEYSTIFAQFSLMNTEYSTRRWYYSVLLLIRTHNTTTQQVVQISIKNLFITSVIRSLWMNASVWLKFQMKCSRMNVCKSKNFHSINEWINGNGVGVKCSIFFFQRRLFFNSRKSFLRRKCTFNNFITFIWACSCCQL